MVCGRRCPQGQQACEVAAGLGRIGLCDSNLTNTRRGTGERFIHGGTRGIQVVTLSIYLVPLPFS